MVCRRIPVELATWVQRHASACLAHCSDLDLLEVTVQSSVTPRLSDHQWHAIAHATSHECIFFSDADVQGLVQGAPQWLEYDTLWWVAMLLWRYCQVRIGVELPYDEVEAADSMEEAMEAIGVYYRGGEEEGVEWGEEGEEGEDEEEGVEWGEDGEEGGEVDVDDPTSPPDPTSPLDGAYDEFGFAPRGPP